ncbi:alpha-protein kinase vwkA-like [Montipora foliosa]|uniref:alpha-protein kinase vwkA-like n=1 Tax=Montipora foliosa TaxID=591990 RepID=UPI0035F15B63
MPQEYVALEPFIPGKYVKFNSNGGWEDQDISQLMPAFSHWTWEISGHKYMVCDLQGVKCQYDYKLTDPVVHSVERLFGLTDLGVVGMESVLANHKCNFICQELRLQNPMKNVYIPGKSRSTTYSFQLTEEEKMRRQRGRSRYFQVMPAILE